MRSRKGRGVQEHDGDDDEGRKGKNVEGRSTRKRSLAEAAGYVGGRFAG